MSRLVLQLPVTYLPHVIGGKEVYAHRLGLELRRRGWSSEVVVHQGLQGEAVASPRVVEGVPVNVLGPLAPQSRPDVYRRTGDDGGAFARLLDERPVALVHLHDFSPAAGLLHVREARRRGIPSVMTYHSPGQSCLQGSLLHEGRSVCDGLIEAARCTTCRLRCAGVPAVAAQALGHVGVPWDLGTALGRVASAREMTLRFQESFAELVASLDVVHAYSSWSCELLRRNGVPEEKLRYFRSGASAPAAAEPGDVVPSPPAAPPLRLLGFGRLDPVKGFHVVVDAVRALPESVPLEVVIQGPYADTPYGRALRERIGADPRLRLEPPVPPGEMAATLSRYHAVLVPSIWLETGPLTLLEALAAGVPVIGSRLGGIAETVVEGSSGFLHAAGDAQELAALLRRLCEDPAPLVRMRAAMPPSRSSADVAEDMERLYGELVDRRPARPGALGRSA